jgi:lipoprotein-releasing system ATP-binding protein
MPTLVVEKLVKTFVADVGEIPILQGVGLRMEGGESASIVGPSGSGKSTLLHLIGGLDRPTSGDVTVDGQQPFKMSDDELARFRNRTVGFVFQDHHLLPQCSVLENVLIPALAADGVTPEIETRAKELIERVGLSARLTHRPAQLSGGERQRAAIARALVNKPTLLLCDEPTGNLDPRSAANVADALLELGRSPEVILIIVTHSMELAGRLAKKYELLEGKLVGG